MPNKTIKSFAERSGKTETEVEEIWDAVKAKASKKFDKEDGQFWAYVNRTVQFKLGLANKKTSFKDYVEKDKKQFTSEELQFIIYQSFVNQVHHEN